MSMETIYSIYLAAAFLFAVLAVVTTVILDRIDRKRDEESESLRRVSEAKLAQKSVPIMLRRQAD